MRNKASKNYGALIMKKIAILIIILGFCTIAWIRTFKVAQITDFNSEVTAIATEIVDDSAIVVFNDSTSSILGWISDSTQAAIDTAGNRVLPETLADSLAEYSKTTDIELIYVDAAEADTHATVILSANVRTNIATTMRIYEANKFVLSGDSLKLKYTGDDSIVAHVVVDVSIQETDGSSDFELYIGLNDTTFRSGIDRKVANNDIGAFGSSRFYSMGTNDSVWCFIENESGTQDATITHLDVTISGRKK